MCVRAEEHPAGQGVVQATHSATLTGSHVVLVRQFVENVRDQRSGPESKKFIPFERNQTFDLQFVNLIFGKIQIVMEPAQRWT